MKKIVCASIMLMAMAGCRPMPLYYVEVEGPPEYKLGWQDGCDTGVSAQGGFSYIMAYGFKKRPELSNSEHYKAAWNEGFTYCRFVAAAQPQQGDFWK
jgi:hypothetical protein